MTTLLRVRHLQVEFGGPPVVDDVDLDLDHGDLPLQTYAGTTQRLCSTWCSNSCQ